MSPIILIGAGILLLGLGAALGYWLSVGLRKREETKVADIQQELDEYRQHVTEHFSETAQHFQALGQQYQSLYKHMAHGAEALCDPANSDAMLEFPAADVAALASDVEARADAPESIKDYAPEEENEPDAEKAKPADPEILEMTADVETEDTVGDEPKAKEEIPDTISKSTGDEADRTVH